MDYETIDQVAFALAAHDGISEEHFRAHDEAFRSAYRRRAIAAINVYEAAHKGENLCLL